MPSSHKCIGCRFWHRLSVRIHSCRICKLVNGCAEADCLCSSEHRLSRANQATRGSELGVAYMSGCSGADWEASIKRMEVVSAENSHASDKQCALTKRKKTALVKDTSDKSITALALSPALDSESTWAAAALAAPSSQVLSPAMYRNPDRARMLPSCTART